MLIEIQDIEAPSNPYNFAKYPGEGVYRHSGQYWFVNASNVVAWFLEITASAIKQPGVTNNATGITESLLLRSIAVAQRPELAKDLT